MIATLLTVLVLAGVTMATAAMYLLAILIGAARRVPDLGSVAVINILLGWTLVGWVVALAIALRSVTVPVPVMQFVQSLSPGPPAPRQLPAARWSGPPSHRSGEPPGPFLPPPGPGGQPGEE